MAHTSTHTLRITVMEEDGDELEHVTLECVVSFTPGTPESGRFGPPENYDPGSGDEFSLDSVKRVNADGTRVEASVLDSAWAQTWLEKNEEWIAEQADADSGPEPEYDPVEAAWERELANAYAGDEP
jgi:hypothetical protein